MNVIIIIIIDSVIDIDVSIIFDPIKISLVMKSFNQFSPPGHFLKQLDTVAMRL